MEHIHPDCTPRRGTGAPERPPAKAAVAAATAARPRRVGRRHGVAVRDPGWWQEPFEPSTTAASAAHAAAGPVRVRVLGALRATVDGRAVRLGGPIPERVLLALALAAPRAVSLERLIDTVWESPPATADKAIRVHVGRLRRVLGTGAIETCSRGYRLASSVGQDRLDYLALRSEALAAGATPDGLRLMTEALATWSEPIEAAPGTTGEVEDALASLAQLHLADEERHSELVLGTGLDEEALSTLRSRCERSPFRERRWEQLLRALVAAGRPAEAIETYQRCRSLFGDEFGVPPGTAVQAAYDRAVAADLGTATFLECRVPLIGREDDLERIDALLIEHPLVTLVGGPGLGKTQLCLELARRRRQRGEAAVVLEVPPPHRAHWLCRDIAGELGVVRTDEASASAAVVDHLTGVAAVVFDGAQRNEEALAQLIEVIRAARPRLRILITSRAPLGITGETHVELGPLATPDLGEPWVGTGATVFAVRRGLGAHPTDDQARALFDEQEWARGVPLLLELAGRVPAGRSIEREQARRSTVEAVEAVVESADPAVAGSVQRLVALPVDVSARLLDRLGTPRAAQRALVWQGLADGAGPPARVRAPDAIRDALRARPGGVRTDLRAEVRRHLIDLGRLARPDLGGPPDYQGLAELAVDLSSVRWLLADPDEHLLELLEQVAELLGLLGLSHEAAGPLAMAHASVEPLRRARAALAEVRSLPLLIAPHPSGSVDELRRAAAEFRRRDDHAAAALTASLALLHLRPGRDRDARTELSRLATALAPSPWLAAVAELAVGVAELTSGAAHTAQQRLAAAEVALAEIDQRSAAFAAFLQGTHTDEAPTADPLEHLERARVGADAVGDRPLAAAARLVTLQHLRTRGHFPPRGVYAAVAAACDAAGLTSFADLTRRLARADNL